MSVVSSTKASARWTNRDVMACSASAALAGLVYLNALHNPFVYDDHRTILDNGSIWNVWDLRTIVGHEATRPLINFSYAIDRALWGTEPFGFHLTSVLLHMLNVALLYRFVWHVTGDRDSGAIPGPAVRPSVTALVGAALFAVHPMMTEAVGYISGRSEVLCATFFLSALLCARRWMIGGGTAWLFGSFGLWIAALFTKEIAVVFPCVVLCYDRWLLRSSPAEERRRLLCLHLPLVGAALAGGAARLAVFVALEHTGDVSVRWLSALDELDVIRRYLLLMLVPSGQAIFHGVRAIHSLFDARALTGLGAVGSITAIAWWVRRLDGGVGLGLLWFLSLLVPSSALFVLGHGEAMAEHRVYLASCGLFLAGALAIGRVEAALGRARLIRVLAYAALTVSLLSLSARTMLRNAVWASPVRLWQEAAEGAPDEWIPHAVLGEALDNTGRHEEAIAAHRAALRLRPEEETGYMKLGTSLAETGRFEEATAIFEALRLLKPESTTVSTGLGAVAMISGRPDEARRHFLESIDKDPRDVASRQWLAVLEEDVEKNPSAALRWCEELQRLTPGRLATDECIRRNRSRVAAIGGGAR